MGKERCERAVIKVVAINNAANNTFSYLHKASRGSKRKLLRFEGLCPGSGPKVWNRLWDTPITLALITFRANVSGSAVRLSRNISKFRSIHTDGIGGSRDCFGSACSLVQHHSLLRWMFYDFIAPELVKVLCLLWTLESVLATASFDESAILMSQPYRARIYPVGQIPSRKNNHGP